MNHNVNIWKGTPRGRAYRLRITTLETGSLKVCARETWMNEGPRGTAQPHLFPRTSYAYMEPSIFIGKVPLCLKQDPVASWSCLLKEPLSAPSTCVPRCLFFIVQLTCFSEGAGNFLSQEQGKKNLSWELASHCLKVWGFSHKTQYLTYESCQGTSWKRGSGWVGETIQKGQFPLVSRTGEVRLPD